MGIMQLGVCVYSVLERIHVSRGLMALIRVTPIGFSNGSCAYPERGSRAFALVSRFQEILLFTSAAKGKRNTPALGLPTKAALFAEVM